MKGVVKRHVKPKYFCVFDGWFASKALCISLGYKHAPLPSMMLDGVIEGLAITPMTPSQKMQG